VAEIDEDLCIQCQLCIVACHDGAHPCIHPAAKAPTAGRRAPWVDEPECVGCNLCQLVCPVEGCISMVERRRGPERESWNDRVAAGRGSVPGGLADLESS
jgi:dihydropyrimidine dehydrogenase (NAD+) subunit PreA